MDDDDVVSASHAVVGVNGTAMAGRCLCPGLLFRTGLASPVALLGRCGGWAAFLICLEDFLGVKIEFASLPLYAPHCLER